MQICHGNRISWSELLCQDQLLRWTIEILEFMTLNTCECYLINFKERGISYFPNCETLPFSFDKVFFCIPRISAFCDLGWVVKYKRWDLPDAPRCAANHWGNTFLANLPQIWNVSENFFSKIIQAFQSVSHSFNQHYFVRGDGKEWDVSASMRFWMGLNVNQIYLEFLKTRTILPASQTQLPVDCLTFKIAIFILPLKCWTLNLAAVLWSNDQSPCRGLQQDWKGNS